MTNEQTLILIKPDALIKSLIGNILTELSEMDVDIVGAKIVKVSKELAEDHYRNLKEKDFFDELIKYIMGHYHTKRVLALVYEGEDAINKMRKIVGSTHPEEAHPTTIRGKYGRITSKGIFENAIHASESKKEAEREIKLWFDPDELTNTIYPAKKVEVKKQELVWS
ncbi:nucleoside-diphosphate kinase [Candidatus Woesearchaeota archaeon]|nr:nucleoside-diphosphate kinase [Candidatus Woesearchaeota archaeon]